MEANLRDYLKELLKNTTTEDLRDIKGIIEDREKEIHCNAVDEFLMNYAERYKKRKEDNLKPGILLKDGKPLTIDDVGHFIDSRNGQELVSELGDDFQSSLLRVFFSHNREQQSRIKSIFPFFRDNNEDTSR